MDNAREKLEMYKEEVKRNAEIERVNAEIKKINAEITNRKQKIVNLQYDIEQKKERIERNIKELRKAEEEYKNERRFLTRLKKRGNDFEINRLKHNIDYYKETIEIATKESEEKESEIKKLEEEIKSLEDKLSSLPIKETTESIFGLDEKGRLIIDSSLPVKAESVGFEELDKNGYSEIADKMMMVHVTDFFPQNHTILNNYEGKKMGSDIFDYEGVKIRLSTVIHRHTIHFTLNNVVHSTGDGAGTWGREKYIVLEPFKYHTKDKICNLGPEDSYIYGNIHFGDEAILLVRKEAYDELSEEIKNSYNIVLFEGSAEKAVKQMLVQLGYPIFNNACAKDEAGHSYSPESYSENVLNRRNLAINYMLNTNWDGKSEIKLSEEEVVELFKIITKCDQMYISFLRIMDEYYDTIYRENDKVNIAVLRFILGTGLYKNNDGSYSFKSDDEVYEVVKKLHDTRDYKVDLNFYEDFIKVLKKRSNEKKTIIPLDTDRKISDLTSFKNHQMARSFVNELNNIVSKYIITIDGELENSYLIYLGCIENDGVVLSVDVGNNLYDFIDGNYNVLRASRIDNCKLDYEIKIAGSTIGEVLKQVEEIAKTASSYIKQKPQVIDQDKKTDIPLDMNERFYKVDKERLAREINNVINSYQTKIKDYPEKSYDIKVDYIDMFDIELVIKVGVETYDFIKENYSIKEIKPTDFVKPFDEYKISIEANTVGEVIAKVQELVKTASDCITEETKSVTGRSR